MQVFSRTFRPITEFRQFTNKPSVEAALITGLRIAIVGLIPLSIMACNRPRQTQDIIHNLKESVVLITYGDAKGHGTGFLIEGNGDGCAVLTVAHVVPQDREIRLTTHDQKWFESTSVKRLSDADLAVVRFNEQGGATCSYPSLELGNSDRVNIWDTVHMAGYPERVGAEQLVTQFPSGQVTNIETPPLPDGYAISYDMRTVGGMSGAPVIDSTGNVIAVHGLTDIELVSLGRNQQSNLSPEQLAEIDAAEDRVVGQARINHFKWGIPVQTFHRHKTALLAIQDRSALNTSLPEVLDPPDVSDNSDKEAEQIQQKVQELIIQADQLRNQDKNYLEALLLYNEALQLEPENVDAWFGKGFSLENLNRYEESLAAYDKARAINPDYALAWQGRGVSLHKLNRDAEAIAAYDKAIELNPDAAAAWNNRGVSLEKLNRYEEAIASYDKALELNPDDAEVWDDRGFSLAQLNRYEESLASYDKAIVINPNHVQAWPHRGDALRNLNRYEEAIASYDKALELNPDYALAWHNRGFSLRNLNRYEEAIASYDKALEINPDDALAWHNRGWSLHNLNRYEEAIASYDKAIELKPDDALAWNNRGVSLEKLNRDEEAIASYDKAIELKPDDALAWNNRGWSLEKLGRHEEALRSYEKAIDLDPNFQMAVNNLNRLQSLEN